MDSQIVNQFVRATSSVFGQVNNVSLLKTDLTYFPDGCNFPAPVNICLGVTGGFKGQFSIVMAEAVALKTASVALAGKEVTVYDRLVESAVCELANVIAGEASKRLLEMGLDCDITVPSVDRGKDFSTSSACFVGKFECEWGDLQLVVKFDSRAQIK
ncbi:MAG: hypothetical protein CVV42_17930 [Candidatus Riflebacteria bacterium HGW-Riflebacteria-2]|jgi:chemotaxis protein CheX|nr:MAG: hypothetical protein CVV42_17930 [Candidatus Riflebacteria bacterium HGW-Riflebacteria-2]